MNTILSYIENRQPEGKKDTVFVLKECIQEIVLFALTGTDFFSHAVFYGGTALRIFHGLNRFSEDMDFSLRGKDIAFSLQRYLETIEKTLGSYNLNVDVSMKEKRRLSPVQSAFVKGNTLTHLMQISAPKELLQETPSNELLKIKLEIDTDPPEGASYEQKYILFPQPCELSLYDIPSLFAGKLHALLCRNWGNRIKGRDFYDYIWYLSQGYSVHIKHLEQRMRQSGHWEEDAPLTHARLKDLLIQRFETVDIEEAKSDVLPFISSEKALDVWSRDFFISITKDRLKTDLK